MALNLTPEQQEIFDRVVGIVTQNDALRHQFKTAIEELHKKPDWQTFSYSNDSNEPTVLNARAASDAVKVEIRRVEPSLETEDFWLFHKVCDATCDKFREN